MPEKGIFRQYAALQERELTTSRCVIGALRGEGSGPELVEAACRVLEAVESALPCELLIRSSDEIDHSSPTLAEFCNDVFAEGGALLAGAVGGRFVYEMRRRFHLHYKLNPLRSYPALARASRLKQTAQPVDILVVRENLGGIYQGSESERISSDDREVAHTFVQGEKSVRALLSVAARAARERRGMLAVVGKESGLPMIHALWRRCAMEVGESLGIKVEVLDIDYAAYKLLQEPEWFDVVAAPNCFGDILADLGGILAGSRGLTFGGSFSADGAAVYQTNHGAAHDLAGTDTANPAGQIFSTAMMLRETFHLPEQAQLIEDAVQAVWQAGWRTRDLAEPGCRLAGTRKFTELLLEEINRRAVRACEALSALN
ncbi:MAG: isocitrate/isopropylmalate family dehydrogenase [Chthoniobacterales bacterium]